MGNKLSKTKNNKAPKHKFGDVIKSGMSFSYGAGSGLASGLTFGLSDLITKPIGQKLMASDGKITQDEQMLMGYGNMAGNLTSMFFNPTGGISIPNGGRGVPTFPNGGMTNIQPAELEKEENVIMPNGQPVQFNGASHKAGGIDTMLPEGTLVFSDELKTSKGKTFASANKPFLSNINNSSKNMSKYIGQDRKWSENSKKAAQANSVNLFNEQEDMKNKKLMKAVSRAFKKYGGKMATGGEVAKGLFENTGNLMYLLDQGKKYDTVKYNELIPSYLNPSELINDIKGQASISKYNISNVSNGNAGNYLSNVVGLNNATNKALAGVRQGYDNQNVQIDNTFKQINEQNRQIAEEKTAANKGAALSAYYSTLGQTGKNVSDRWSMYELSKNQKEMDMKEFEWFKKLYPYIFNTSGLSGSNPIPKVPMD